MDNLSVDFYDETRAAITTQWDPQLPTSPRPQERARADTVLFACYFLQQLRNLGNHPAAEALEFVQGWYPRSTPPNPGYSTPIQALSAFDRAGPAIFAGMPPDQAYAKYHPGFLVPKDGPGTRRFTVILTDPLTTPSFTLHILGFGLAGAILGWEIPQYVHDSAYLICEHLWQLHGSNPTYPDILTSVSGDCIKATHAGSVTAINLADIALRAVSARFRESN